MRMNKKGAINNKQLFLVLLVFVILFLVTMFATGVWSVGDSDKIADEKDNEKDPAAKPDQVGDCPDDGKTTVYTKVQNDHAATTTYLAGTNDNIKFIDFGQGVSSGVIVAFTNSSTTAWVSSDMDCGNEIEVVAIDDPGLSGGARSGKFTVWGESQYVILHSNDKAKMTVKVKDIDGDDWESLFADGTTSGTNATTGVDMNATNIYDTVAAGDFSVGTDGYLNLEIYVKSATARMFHNTKATEGFGTKDDVTDMGFVHYLCADLGGATNGQEWDSNSLCVTVDGGSCLTDVKDNIDSDSDDYTYVEVSEACYDIGDVDDAYTTIGFYSKAESGEDPDATDDDITIYFLPEGLYASSDNTDEIKKGIYTDASSQTSVAYSSKEVPYVKINVA